MKKLLCILVAGVSLFAAEDKKKDVQPFRLGVGPVLTTEDFGASARLWIRDAFGLSLNVTTSWDQEIEGGEIQLNYKINTKTLFKPYLLVGGGIQRLNLDDINPAIYNENVGTISGGLGLEALLGKSERHGLSVEGAYTHGEIEYSGKTVTGIGQNSQTSKKMSKKVPTFSVGVLYHFYFIPAYERDADGDGVKNDRCPDKAEDMDGYMDEDGCPETDNDNDGILDAQDKCPNEPEDPDSFEDGDGCPEFDNDKDGIKDSDDSCPDKAEDPDGFKDNDGCPEYDNDNDGIRDSDDACPNKKENLNNYQDKDGCPDEKPVEVIIEEEIAAIPVHFINFKMGSAELTDTAVTIVNTLADFLKKWPTVKIEIQGHTDNTGAASYNKMISGKRANTVTKTLVKAGISADRLKAAGYGQEKPIVSNDTKEGRAKNRRVEIIRFDK